MYFLFYLRPVQQREMTILKSLTDELVYQKKQNGTEMAHGSNKQRFASECNKHTVEYMCRQTTRFSHVCSAFFFFFHISTFTFFEFSENRLLSVSRNPIISE